MMPRTTRSSSRASSKIEENSTPKKDIKKSSLINEMDDFDIISPTKTPGRQSRKKPASPQTPRSNKRRKKADNDSEEDDSSSSATPVTSKRPTRQASETPRSSRSSARSTTIIPEPLINEESQLSETTSTSTRASSAKPAESTTSTRRSKRPPANQSPSPKKKAPKTTPKSSSGRGKRSRKADQEEEEEQVPVEENVSDREEESNPDDDEVSSKRARIESPLSNFKLKLPKRLSRVELYDEKLKKLASELSLFDLTDPREATNVWCDWPSEDCPLSAKEIRAILLNRTWYSSTGRREASASISNGNGTTSQSVPKSGSAREIGVISYCLVHLNQKSPNFNVHQSLFKEELSAYKADIYCFQNVESECQTFLQNILKEQGCGFSTISGSNLIAFQLNSFTLLSQHKVSALDFANQIAHECAYPVTWRKSIEKALGTKEVDEMLVSVLLHKPSGQVILVASQSLLPSAEQGARPDITALNITGAMWNLARIWNENAAAERNGQANGAAAPLVNGHPQQNGHARATTPRWLLCGPLNATERSPLYQLARDGYPNDETLDCLRCLRTVKLPTSVSMHASPIDPEEQEQASNAVNGTAEEAGENTSRTAYRDKALIDLLWNAFQHPCKDMTSCYQAVVGREPPFTRLPAGQAHKALDYIWCSGATLEPQTVLLPPCRALASALSSKQENQFQNISMPLMARMSLVPTAS